MKNNNENEAEELKTHFVYAGDYYDGDRNPRFENSLRSFILKSMKKYHTTSVMVTTLNMERFRLITKEYMENYGKESADFFRKCSINDDLESFFEDLRLGNEPDETVHTYFLPKLTKEELELVERRDASYLKTLSWFMEYQHVDEMKLSESSSKYILGLSHRRTFTIEHKKSKFQPSSQTKIVNFGTNRKRRHSSTWRPVLAPSHNNSHYNSFE